MTAAAAAAARSVQAAAQFVLPAADDKRPAVNQRVRKLLARQAVNALHGCTRDIHLLCAFLLGEIQIVDETDGFIFVNRHGDLFGQGAFATQWSKALALRKAADLASFDWPWHVVHLFCINMIVRGKQLARPRQSIQYYRVARRLSITSS